MIIGKCPACGADVSIEDSIEISEHFRCPECGALLEFTGKDPFLVNWIEENWDVEYPFEHSLLRKMPLKRRPRLREESTQRSKRRH